MKAFLSFGFYDIREQQLVSSAVILKHLVEVARDAVAQCPGLEMSGILTPHALDLPDDEDIPCHDIRPCDRFRAEFEAMRALTADSDDTDRVLVLRPGQGALFRSRVHHFHEAVQGRGEPLIVSTIQCTSTVHPMWNLRVADRRFFSRTAVRHPRSGTNFVQPLSTVCPELWEAVGKQTGDRPTGSQHLDPLYRYDGALYGISLRSMDNMDGTMPEMHPVPCPESGGAKENLLLRLPVFQMSRETVINISTLEALLIKNRENGGNQL
ncbi:hypothetical protein LF599_00835 [Pseudodesulfovibrio thermohalotolerans]|uniref:hypothetical protein n=1 Tax=Pseudodesulfovibrio thermohalotolerans TaxID=2880651 RepID=UPI002441F9C3|nr:hypothetical protein [Pseudodesulfovibrio thermohalotolerans]WFS62734.1 hypothetical protein LF599_00835 [Pseudodesulfovibrio thermohalotolerans]